MRAHNEPNNCEFCGGGFHDDIKLHKICDNCRETWYSNASMHMYTRYTRVRTEKDGVAIINISKNPNVYQITMDGVQYEEIMNKVRAYDELPQFIKDRGTKYQSLLLRAQQPEDSTLLQRIDRIERFLNHPGHTFNTFE